MTFNYMAYMFSTCKVCFSIIICSLHRASFSLAEMHKLLSEDTDSHVLRYISHVFSNEMILRSARDLRVFFLIQSCCMPSNMVLASMVPELHGMRMVCSLKVVTPEWFTRTVSFTVVIDYTRYCGSFEVLQG